MIIPADSFIEMGMDALAMQETGILVDELKEFHGLGDGRRDLLMTEIRKRLVIDADTSKVVTPMAVGYLLGLETARALLETMPAAINAKVSI